MPLALTAAVLLLQSPQLASARVQHRSRLSGEPAHVRRAATEAGCGYSVEDKDVCPGSYGSHCAADSVSHVTQLHEGLLRNYDRFTPPPDAVSAKVSMTVVKVNAINTVDQTFKINVYFRHQWKDCRLRWDPLLHNNVTRLSHVPSSRIWTPDTFFSNANEVQSPWAEEYTLLESDGSILLSQRIIIEFYCQMEFRSFPFDRQECVTMAESYGYGPETLSYELPGPGDVFPDAIKMDANPSFDANSVGPFALGEPEARIDRVIVGTREFAAVRYQFSLARIGATTVLRFFLPLWLAVGLSVMGLWIDARATPARVTVAVVTVLVLVNLWFVLTKEVPTVAYLTALDVYFLFCFVFVFANALEYTVLNHLNTRLALRLEKIETKRRHLGDMAKVGGFPGRSGSSPDIAHRQSTSADSLYGPGDARSMTGSPGPTVHEHRSTEPFPGRDDERSKSAGQIQCSSVTEEDPRRQSLDTAGSACDRRGSAATLARSCSTTGTGLFARERRKMSAPRGLNLTKAEKSDLREAFDLFDADRDGGITVSDLAPMLVSMGLSREEVAAMVESCDVDGSGDIDFAEFCTLMQRNEAMRDHLREELRSIDCWGCCGVSKSSARSFEKRYRVVALCVFVLASMAFHIVIAAVA